MKKRFAVITAAASAAVLMGAGPAQASDTVVCGFEAELAYEGGASLSGRQTSFASSRGSVNCAGTVDGRATLGTGTLRISGSGGNRSVLNGTQGCVLGSGRGTVELTVPRLMAIFDPESSDSFSGNIGWRRGARAWAATGSVAGPSGQSGIAVAGIEEAGNGDCVTRTMQTSTLRGRILIGGEVAGAEAGEAVACANHVAGTRNRDRLNGTTGSDLVSGFGKGDRLGGSADEDCLFGGPGGDVLSGGPGADTIDCGPGKDVVRADASDTVAANCEAVRSH